MFTRLRCPLNVKLKPVVLSCAYGFGNNFKLHSVYFSPLVDLENKRCTRLSLVNIYRQSAKHISNKEFRLKVILYEVSFSISCLKFGFGSFHPRFHFVHENNLFIIHTSSETKLLTNHLKGFFRLSRLLIQLALWQCNYQWHPYTTLVFKINQRPKIN